MAHFACGHIDLVAGLSSVDQNKGKVTDVPLNPDAFRDAARVYISQMCDVDNQFQCAPGSTGNVTERSCVVAKADAIRLICRDGGIKIISGGDTHNSKGELLRSVPTIDLIGGNWGGELKDILKTGKAALQPIPRGKHLMMCLEAILKNIKELADWTMAFKMTQMEFNKTVVKHRHPDHVAMSIGILGAGNPEVFLQGLTGFSSRMKWAGTGLMAEDLYHNQSFTALEASLAGTKDSYISNPLRPGYINSRAVNTT